MNGQQYQGPPQGYAQGPPQGYAQGPPQGPPQGYAQGPPQGGYQQPMPGQGQQSQGQQQSQGGEQAAPRRSMSIPGMAKGDRPRDVPDAIRARYKDADRTMIQGRFPGIVTFSRIDGDDKHLDAAGNPAPRVVLAFGVDTQFGPRSWMVGVTPLVRPAFFWAMVDALVPDYRGQDITDGLFRMRTVLIDVGFGTGDYADKCEVKGFSPLPIEQSPWAAFVGRGAQQSQGQQGQFQQGPPQGQQYGPPPGQGVPMQYGPPPGQQFQQGPPQGQQFQQAPFQQGPPPGQGAPMQPFTGQF